MNKRTFTPAELIALSAKSQFSNYSGEDDLIISGYEGENDLGLDASESYIGENDPFVDFGGSVKSFAESLDRGRIFNINLRNTSSTDDVEVILTPGLQLFYAKPDGLVVDGAFKGFVNGVLQSTGTMNGSGAPEKISMFHSWIQQFPTTALGVKISGDNVLQIEQPLEIEKQSPFKRLESKNIFPAAYTDETANKDKVATVTEQFQLDSQTTMRYLVLKGTQVTLTFFCGASLNMPKALVEKQNRAKRNISVMGGPKAVSMSRKIARG